MQICCSQAIDFIYKSSYIRVTLSNVNLQEVNILMACLIIGAKSCTL